MKDYSDIIGLPHYEPHHPRMSMQARAAQFAPFAALTGHDEAIGETARLTDLQTELDDERTALLNRKIALLIKHLPSNPEVEVTYFIPDTRKQGGAYKTYKGTLRRISPEEGVLKMDDNTVIPLRHIFDLQSPLFDTLDT